MYKNNPTIIGSVFISGDVEFGENVSCFHGASIRGDWAKISIGNNSNVQDNVSIHCHIDLPTTIGDYVTIGHNAVVHSATIEDNCVIGMGSVLLNGCHIGENSIVGAGAVIGQGKIIPKNSIVVGNPFKILRELSDEEVKMNRLNAEVYVDLAKKYADKGSN